MEIVNLSPKTLIVPGQREIRDVGALALYKRILQQGVQEDILDPVIIAHKSKFDFSKNYDPEKIATGGQDRGMWNVERAVEDAYQRGAQFFLLDGLHKSMAAAFEGTYIIGVRIDSEEDLEKIRQDTREGKRTTLAAILSELSFDKVIEEVPYSLYSMLLEDNPINHADVTLNYADLTVLDCARRIADEGLLPAHIIGDF